MSMNRYKASATHLAASAGVIAIFCAIVFFIWYPAPYFFIEGTIAVITILIIVDVVLGPLLTLIVFKPGKPSLKFDLSVIVLIQVSALLYGANTIYSERPYFVPFAIDRFTVIQANQTKTMDLSTINPQINYQQPGPSYVYAKRPSDPQIRFQILREAAAGGADIDRHPELYRNFKTHIPGSFDRSLELDTLAKQYADNKAVIDRFRLRYPDTKSLAFYPLQGKHNNVVLVISRNNAEVIDYIAIDPWKGRKSYNNNSAPIPGLPGAPVIDK